MTMHAMHYGLFVSINAIWVIMMLGVFTSSGLRAFVIAFEDIKLESQFNNRLIGLRCAFGFTVLHLITNLRLTNCGNILSTSNASSTCIVTDGSCSWVFKKSEIHVYLMKHTYIS